ncbi:hypothetical protein N0V95_009743 [Ascochyta clinopodiicola]|nr:hypothetical protein N0V95_009743 [Ascochyta clinopodiicola]
MYSSQKQAVNTPPQQEYAEYQASAPELAPQEAGKMTAEMEAGPAPDYLPPGYSDAGPVAAPKRKKILGLAPWLFFALIALIVLIIVGGVVGGVVGTRQKSTGASSVENSSQRPSSTQSQTPSSTSGTPTPTSSPLVVLDANYGGSNISSEQLTRMQQDNQLVVNMSNPTPWTTTDVWFGFQKCLSILYSSNADIRTFVACQSDGTFTLGPGSDVSNSHSNIITRHGPSSNNFAIVSVVWGKLELREQDVYRTLYTYKINGSMMTLGNDLFGGSDTYVGAQKTAVIWYTEDDFKTFRGIYGKEGAIVKFP